MSNRELSIAVFAAMLGVLASIGLNLYTITSVWPAILDNQKVAWCGVDIAMKRKSHPSECKGVLP